MNFGFTALKKGHSFWRVCLVFSFKAETTLKSTAIVSYPLLVAIMNNSMAIWLWLHENALVLDGFLPVRMER